MEKLPDPIGPYKFEQQFDQKTVDLYLCFNTLNNRRQFCMAVDYSYFFQESDFKRYLKFSHPNLFQFTDIQFSFTTRKFYLFFPYSAQTMEETLIQLNGSTDESNLIYFKQFMLALKYLHDNDFPHKNISISSMRIDSNGILILYGANIFPVLTAKLNITEYMAPECFTGNPYDEKKADIWSAGICLYAMLYNHLPWMIDENEEDNEEALVQQIQSGEIIYEDFLSGPYIELISSMLRLNPDERPTAAEVLENPILSELEIERYHDDEVDSDGNVVALFDAIITYAQEMVLA